jgi:hypothetical protein
MLQKESYKDEEECNRERQVRERERERETNHANDTVRRSQDMAAQEIMWISL